MKIRTIYSSASCYLLSGFIHGSRWVPRRLALAGGERIGRLLFHLARKNRYGNSDRALKLSENKGRHFIDLSLKRSLRDLSHVFPDYPEEQLTEIVRNSYINAGRSLVEALRIPRLGKDELLSRIDADSFEPLRQVFDRGKGLLVLTPHLGAWELLAAYLVHRLDRPFSAVVHRQRFEPYNYLLQSLRDKGAGVRVLYHDSGARPTLSALRENLPVGVLSDLDLPKLKGVFVELFTRPTYTPVGPAALARASGAGVVPVYIRWKSGPEGNRASLRHHVHVLPEIEFVRTRDKAADILENTQRWTRSLEEIVRDHPEQWIWYHDRWRTRPD